MVIKVIPQLKVGALQCVLLRLCYLQMRLIPHHQNQFGFCDNITKQVADVISPVKNMNVKICLEVTVADRLNSPPATSTLAVTMRI